MNKTLDKIDLFGREFNFRINNKPRHTTNCSKLFTIIFIIICMAIYFFNFKQFLKRNKHLKIQWINKLDEEDREEIAERFEPNEDDGLDSVDDAPMGDEPMGDEESPEVEDELGEIMDKLESFVNTPVESMVDTSDLEEDDSVLDMADDLGSEEHSDELEDIEEIDLDEIKSQINKHVDETLSKYFK